MGFPRVPVFIEPGRPGKKRAHATAKGTPKKPLPPLGSRSNAKRKSIYAVLAQNAMALGWLNGIRIKDKGTRT